MPGGGKLEVDVGSGHKLLEGGRAFIVQSLEFGPKAGGDKGGVYGLVRGEDSGAGAGLHRFGEDAVTIVIVEDER
jgi:hypothetical protein